MTTVKRVHVIACGVLALDLKEAARRLALDVSMEFLPGGLHATPRKLRSELQHAIDRTSTEERGDLIAVGYGVCGMGTVGIHARNVPLAVPRVNDCIALFLGSDAAYREQFSKYPGTYYISAGWVQEKAQPQVTGAPDGGNDACPRGPEFDELVAKHGRENAEAIDFFLGSWKRNYQRAAFIDTGAPQRRDTYAAIAKDMADRFGWSYEELTGSYDLLTSLLKTRATTDEILIVPPHHVTAYDAVKKTLTAVPVWTADDGAGDEQVLVFEGDASGADANTVRLGLGIDAGGTYTDAVIFDFDRARVLAKAKALTTKWDFTVGITNALDQLPADMLTRVDLAAVSTTLATNAIVEGRGQDVGLLIMPPFGLFDASHVDHRPVTVIAGRQTVDGTEISPIDPDEVRRAAREMIARERVGAFAVTGFASYVNPAHELSVKEILRAKTGLTVTCGHEVSDTVNYRLRAETAALNARIIPCLEGLLNEVTASLASRGIAAPVMVVKSDGSLMSLETARARPIETILSGSAASVAGASFLSGIADALVVDVGGTTTDTATLHEGVVRVCEQGASVGGRRTHVKALDLRTCGLGGDSLIQWTHRELRIGPRRVGPVAWLAAEHAGTREALDYIARHTDAFDVTTRGADLLALAGRRAPEDLNDEEAGILKVLAERPHALHELAARTKRVSWKYINTERLEESQVIQRCGLTPTDILHASGELALWDAEASKRLSALFAKLAAMDAAAFGQRVIERFVHMLAMELFKKQMGDEIGADALDESEGAMALIRNFLAGGSADVHVRIRLKHPVVGIGAPVGYFLPRAAAMLETEAVIPADAEVANAIGAITSSVVVQKVLAIAPGESGGYSVQGLAEAPTFDEFQEAHNHAVDALKEIVRRQAAEAGTSQTRLEIVVRDRTAEVADGSELFIGRTLHARLSGRPDVARLARRG